MSFAKYFLGLVCLVCLTAPAVVGEEHTFNYQKIIDVTQPITFDLTMATGQVTVSGSAGNRLVVEAVKKIKAVDRDEAEEVADHIEIRVDQSGHQISVATNYLTLGSRKKSFWRKLFGGGSDSYGDVDYLITLPVSDRVTIKAISAEVVLTNVEAEVTVENAGGNTRAEFVYGPITVRQPAGLVDLQWIEGDVRVHSNSGLIKVGQLQGSLDLHSRTGDITIKTELDSPQDFFVETETGKIDIAVPETSSGTLHIGTESGQIKTEVPIAVISTARNRLVGEFGAGGPRINLSSLTGDVTVVQY